MTADSVADRRAAKGFRFPADIHEVSNCAGIKPAAEHSASARYVARQPILTREEQVFGYELLFRDGVENYFNGADTEAAARSTVDHSMLIGLDVLCSGRRAFINSTREVLLKDYITLLPSGQTVVEILESVEPDDLVIWEDFVAKPARAAGLPVPRLVVLDSPYRYIVKPIVDYALEQQLSQPDRTVTVLVPELIESRWYHYFLHNNRPEAIRALLLLNGNQRITVATVPYHIVS